MSLEQPLVLVVDENRTMRIMLRKFLEEADMSVAEAENGEEALEVFQQLHPDAILLDVEMPVMDGITACSELRKRPDGRYVPIMMLTGRDDPSSINKSFEAGATEFSTKPINWDVLGHRVRYLIRTGHNFVELQNKQEELNKAHKELEQINDKLEERVVERTAQLKKTTDELQATLDSLRSTQSHLIESEKIAMLGDLLEGFAKEAHTPIDASMNAALSLKNDRAGMSSAKKSVTEFENYLTKSDDAIKIIILNLQRASDLILNFKQLAIDRTTEIITTFDFKEYLEEIIFGLYPLLKKTQLKVEINCPPHLILSSYAGIFFRIIMTFVTNSIVHGYGIGETGKLTLDVSTNDDTVTLCYKDNGKGISEANLKKIFEPFFTTKTGAENVGLGLHIVYNQVTKILKGTIRCESKPGEGVCFIINFPKKAQ